MNPEEMSVHLADHAVGLNHPNTVGVMEISHITNENTVRIPFKASYLKEWADLIYEAEGDEAVDVIVTPRRPMIAAKRNPSGEDPNLGIGIAHREPVGDTDDEF